MINDQISRLKNTSFLPKGEMPNYSHLERPSLVVVWRSPDAKRQSKLHSNQAFPGTRLRLHVLSNLLRALFSSVLGSHARGWWFGYSFEIVQRAQTFSIIDDKKNKRTCSPRSSLLCASRNPFDLDMLFPARPHTPHKLLYINPGLVLVTLKRG